MEKKMKNKWSFFVLFILILSLGIYVGYSQKSGIDKIVKPNTNSGYDVFEQSDMTQDKPKANDDISNSRRNAITKTVAMISPAIVGINVTEIRTYRDPFWSDDPIFRYFFGDRSYKQKVQGLGSGFLISKDGYILTNDHVAGNASKIVVTLTNGEKHNAKIIGTDPLSDVALLKIDGNDFPYVKLGNSDDVLIGEWVIAFGNPFGFFEINDKPTVTVGVVSNLNVALKIEEEQRSYKGMIQTDAAINSGNSGGPLVNSIGEVIGMNTIIYTPNQGSVGLGFAIPVNRVKNILKELRETGKIDRSFWTGLEIQALNRNIARYFGLKRTDGVIITDVAKNSPGEKAGIVMGDIIIEINQKKINNENDVLEIINECKSGDVLQMKIFRDNKTFDVNLKLEKRK
jgi:serine protease Do